MFDDQDELFFFEKAEKFGAKDFKAHEMDGKLKVMFRIEDKD